jgi:DNA-binding response OmpR family regulator
VNINTELLPHVPMSLKQRAIFTRLHGSSGVVRHEELAELWPRSSINALNMVIYGLRKKITGHGYKIISHRGLGYSMVRESERKAA